MQTDEERRAKHAAYMREWARKHPRYQHERRMELQRERRAKNPEAVAKYNAKASSRLKEKYHSDPERRRKQIDNARKWRLANPEYYKSYQREWHLLHMAKQCGLTHEQFEELRPRMDGPCEICGVMKRLVMDHDHETGKYRGLLCKSCNTGIGHLGDTSDHVRRAIAYLERSLNA